MSVVTHHGMVNSGHYQAFIIRQVCGTWSKVKEVPGTTTLNKGAGIAWRVVRLGGQLQHRRG
jgi:ubiquitin C-terminal hydrolase